MLAGDAEVDPKTQETLVMMARAVASSTDALVTSTKSVFHHSRECHFVVSQFNHEFVLIVIKVSLSIYISQCSYYHLAIVTYINQKYIWSKAALL